MCSAIAINLATLVGGQVFQELQGHDQELKIPSAARTDHEAIARSARSSFGQSETRERVKGVEPLARINNRIPNRIHSRRGNRVDRDYHP